jgi:hypothetical protein
MSLHRFRALQLSCIHTFKKPYLRGAGADSCEPEEGEQLRDGVGGNHHWARGRSSHPPLHSAGTARRCVLCTLYSVQCTVGYNKFDFFFK